MWERTLHKQAIPDDGLKGPKALGTIFGNSSTNSKQKLRHLSEKLKGSWINYTDKISLYYLIKHA